METETGITYYKDLPEGYVIMEDYKELFTLKEGEITITVDNAIIREGLELILYNPQTDVYYPRYLTYSSVETSHAGITLLSLPIIVCSSLPI